MRDLFRNYYECPDCGHRWDDDWDEASTDTCMRCLKEEVTPYASRPAIEAEYDELLEKLRERGLDNREKLASALGLRPAALWYRKTHPECVKLEHVLAAEGLLARMAA